MRYVYSSITGLVSTSRAMRSTSASRRFGAQAVGERKREVFALAHGGYVGEIRSCAGRSGWFGPVGPGPMSSA